MNASANRDLSVQAVVTNRQAKTITISPFYPIIVITFASQNAELVKSRFVSLAGVGLEGGKGYNVTMSEGMNYTYILRCSDGTYYTGWTNDLQKRLASHNDGTGSKYTRTRLPVELVYSECFETKQEAMRREWEIKQMHRADKQKLIDAAGLVRG